MTVIPVIIGVDVGGTNTDAVIVEKGKEDPVIIGKSKTLTTDDVTSGVKAAIHNAIIDSREHSGNDLAVLQINIGTTHFINAVVEGRYLAKVSVVRLCKTASKWLPPFSDFPENLTSKIRETVYLVNGGYQIDGTEISAVNEQELENCIHIMKSNNEKNIVVSGVFSTLRDEQEERVVKFIRKHFPEASITTSHRLGKLGLLERENAAILNESIKPLCKETIQGFRKALSSIGLQCPFYFTQNDGTLLSEENAIKYPVLTFASGATNSMRGAAFLSKQKDAIVVDIGGTSCDVGLLMNGFPREASTNVSVGGVKTNFRMPDVVSIGLGGGSYVTECEPAGAIKVGPRSAGYCIEKEAYVFAEPEHIKDRRLTATDIAVASGIADVGLKSNVKQLDIKLVTAAMDQIFSMMGECVDKMRFASKSIPLILVGGGSILVDRNRKFDGIGDLILPKDYDVANAVGAALSQISGYVDHVVDLGAYLNTSEMEHAVKDAMEAVDKEAEREQVTKTVKKKYLDEARERAFLEYIHNAEQNAIAQGAKKGTLTVVDKEDIPLSYIPGHQSRIKIKVAGDLDDSSMNCKSYVPKSVYKTKPSIHTSRQKKQEVSTMGNSLSDSKVSNKVEEPTIDSKTGEWILSEYDIECLHIGAGILGCGGGGNPHLARTLALRLLRNGKKIRVDNPVKFLRKADPVNDLITTVSFMGAPLVMYEKLVAGNETTGALEGLMHLYQKRKYKDGALKNADGVKIESGNGVEYVEDYKVSEVPSKGNDTDVDKPNIVALMSAEIGGLNSIEPLLVGAMLDLPVLDCDGMGRAFPELQMFTPFIYGSKPYPACLADDKGRRSVVIKADSPKCLENHFRQEVMKMGSSAGLTMSTFCKDDVMKKTIHYSLSHAWRIGDTIMKARSKNESPVDAITKSENGTLLIYGKVIDIVRESTSGFTVGHFRISGLDTFHGKEVLVEFQNEFLVARNIVGKQSNVLACVPDLITLMDSETAQPLPVEEIRFGIRVSVVIMPAHPLISSPRALRFVGPRAFGLGDDVQYKPIGKFVDTKPVCPDRMIETPV
ncbi:hypothetical protein ACF0H5_006654 [Mactra antiquata]